MSLHDRIASSAEGKRELSAARLRYTALKLLHRALDQSGTTKSELASRLGVRKSAVSQVFRGDGNLRLNTLADYLDALGYEAQVELVKAGELRQRAIVQRDDTEWKSAGSVIRMTRHPAARRRRSRDDFESIAS